MQTAEKGATRLERDDGWTISDTGQAPAGSSSTPSSAYAAQVLGVPGGSFTADSSACRPGKKLKSALSSFDDAVRGWARQNGLITTAGLGSFGGILVVLAVLLTLFLGFVNPLGISVLALIPGLFAIGAFELLRPGSSTKRTAAGRELWSRVGGFRRMLATPSSEDRFDFSGRKELYTAYIPWAVAFGVADEWAREVPDRDRRGAAAALLRQLLRLHRRQLRLGDVRRLLLLGQLGDLRLPGHAELVVQQRRGRRLLRRWRGRRRRGWLLVSRCTTMLPGAETRSTKERSS